MEGGWKDEKRGLKLRMRGQKGLREVGKLRGNGNEEKKWKR